jgi:hypothetical protein
MQVPAKAILGGGLFFLAFALTNASGDDSAMPAKIETIQIQNDVCEAEITVQPFVHLLSFRFRGAKNDLLNFTTPNPIAPGHPKRPEFIVGAKLWYAPEIADSHRFGLLTGAVTHTVRDVNAQLDPDPISGLQGTIHLQLDDHEAKLTITSTLKNVGVAEKETSCWWPVSFEPGGWMESVPIPAFTEPHYNYHFWSYGGTASEPACRIEKDRVVLDVDRPMNPPLFKIGFVAREIVVHKPDCVFRITAIDPPVDPARKYPHGDSPVMLYSDQKTGFMEAELSGPLVALKPGDQTAFTFTILLAKPSPK